MRPRREVHAAHRFAAARPGPLREFLKPLPDPIQRVPMQPIPTPFEYRTRVRPEWIDPNGHMNIANYVVVFDAASDVVFEHIGFDWDRMRAGDLSAFVLGMNLDYRCEIFEADALRITTQLLDWDHKRMHLFHRMYRGEEPSVAATNEVLFSFVSMRERRSTAWPEPMAQALARVAAAHSRLRVPEGAFRKLGIRRG
jgi:acyl-CoA thioester hydrolase